MGEKERVKNNAYVNEMAGGWKWNSVCVSSSYHFFLLSWLDNFFGNAKNQTLNIFISLFREATR